MLSTVYHPSSWRRLNIEHSNMVFCLCLVFTNFGIIDVMCLYSYGDNSVEYNIEMNATYITEKDLNLRDSSNFICHITQIFLIFFQKPIRVTRFFYFVWYVLLVKTSLEFPFLFHLLQLRDALFSRSSVPTYPPIPFRHRASYIYDDRCANLQMLHFIYLFNKYKY
jgi:hypothetical protein